MISDKEAEDYFEEKYEKNNHKRPRSMNVPERLFKDYHKTCIDLGKSMSKEVRIHMVKTILENKDLIKNK